MRGVVAFAIVSSAVAWSCAARADDEGATCSITADCGVGLRCIDGACMALVNGKAATEMGRRERSSVGDRAWIGDGKGYVVQVVAGDVAATALAGVLVGITFATGQGRFAFAALFPTTLTGPIIHAANGRGGPAAISFFAWAAVPPTATFFSVVAGFGTGSSDVVVTLGYAIGLGAAAGLTALDAFFARDIKRPPSRDESALTIVPSVTPTRGGFTAGLAGSF